MGSGRIALAAPQPEAAEVGPGAAMVEAVAVAELSVRQELAPVPVLLMQAAVQRSLLSPGASGRGVP